MRQFFAGSSLIQNGCNAQQAIFTNLRFGTQAAPLHAQFINDGHDPGIQVTRQDDASLRIFSDESGDFIIQGNSRCDAPGCGQRNAFKQIHTLFETLFKGNFPLHGCFRKRRHFIPQPCTLGDQRQQFAFGDGGIKVEHKQRLHAFAPF